MGRELYRRGLVTTRGGNLSVRDRDHFLITRTGSNLGGLSPEDFVEVELSERAPMSQQASCETPVHRSVYNTSEHRAIVHAHGVNTIALAQMIEGDGTRALHNEGLVGLGWIPVVDTTVPGQESGEAPQAISAALGKSCSVMVRGHGAFTGGSSLDNAFYKMLLLEDSCQINLLVMSRQRIASAPPAIGLLKPRRRIGRRPSGRAE